MKLPVDWLSTEARRSADSGQAIPPASCSRRYPGRPRPGPRCRHCSDPQRQAAPTPIASVPPPVIVPPVQFMVPLTVTAPAVLRVPPLIVRSPDIDEADAIAQRTAREIQGGVARRDRQTVDESEAVEECVTVIPDVSITTSSDGPGSAPVLQLEGVSQSPPAGLIQVTQASSVRSLSWISAGRKPLRRFRRRVGGADERGKRGR